VATFKAVVLALGITGATVTTVLWLLVVRPYNKRYGIRNREDGNDR